jgi:hypothetical protein
MIGHDHPVINLQGKEINVFSQETFEENTIFLIAKDDLTPIAAIEDVIDKRSC